MSVPAPPFPGPAVLFVPAANLRALSKAPSLGADVVLYDLEDAVALDALPAAREALRAALARERPPRVAVRINHPSSPHFTEDLLLARGLRPDAIVVPKASADDLALVEAALAESDAPPALALWAMVETPVAVLDLARIASAGGRLAALVAGTNDLGAMTGASRAHMHPWLMQIVLAARAHGLAALDGVHNAVDDAAGFMAEAREGVAMGFDGKTLVHPSQIGPTREAWRPTPEEAEAAREIAAAFDAAPDAAVLRVGGRMVERMHLAAARRTLAGLGEIR